MILKNRQVWQHSAATRIFIRAVHLAGVEVEVMRRSLYFNYDIIYFLNYSVMHLHNKTPEKFALNWQVS